MIAMKLSAGSEIEHIAAEEEIGCIVQIGNEPPYLINVKEPNEDDDFIEKMIKECTNINSDTLDDIDE